MTQTEQTILGMLTENTGAHLLDSGGAYGRNWERNQGRDFANEPRVSASFFSWKSSGEPRRLEIDATVSLYHWMRENLEFDAEMQARLDAYIEEQPAYVSWHTIAEEFAEEEQQRIAEREDIDARDYPRTVNTYNEIDNWDLSQVLEFRILTEDGYTPTHLILQVHGGCDVRGGYTAPVCFRIKGAEEYSWIDSASVNEVWAGGFYWGYEKGSCLDTNALTCSSHKDRGEGPENILTLPVYASEQERLDADDDDSDWWVLVPGDKTAWLNGPGFQEQVHVGTGC